MNDTQSSSQGVGQTGNPQQNTYNNQNLQQGSATQQTGGNGFDLNASGASSSITVQNGSVADIRAQADTTTTTNLTPWIISGALLALAIIASIIFMRTRKI
jgi:hypothetical protein